MVFRASGNSTHVSENFPKRRFTSDAAADPYRGNLPPFMATNVGIPQSPMKSLFKTTAAAALLAAALLFNPGCSRDKTAGQSVDDTAITTKVKAAFAQDPGVRAIGITVNTNLGVVQLSGWANSPEEKTRAEELAKAVPGVKSVENKITLKTDVKKTP